MSDTFFQINNSIISKNTTWFLIEAEQRNEGYQSKAWIKVIENYK